MCAFVHNITLGDTAFCPRAIDLFDYDSVAILVQKFKATTFNCLASHFANMKLLLVAGPLLIGFVASNKVRNDKPQGNTNYVITANHCNHPYSAIQEAELCREAALNLNIHPSDQFMIAEEWSNTLPAGCIESVEDHQVFYNYRAIGGESSTNVYHKICKAERFVFGQNTCPMHYDGILTEENCYQAATLLGLGVEDHRFNAEEGMTCQGMHGPAWVDLCEIQQPE
jgi:hypothetical protein